MAKVERKLNLDIGGKVSELEILIKRAKTTRSPTKGNMNIYIDFPFISENGFGILYYFYIWRIISDTFFNSKKIS